MPDISQITLPTGTTYDIKDAIARAAASGGIQLKGITTTALTDEATTNPITIDSSSYTAKANDAVFYGKKEFVFDGTKWHEFGDMSGLGSLAKKDSASGNFTPQGSVSAPTISVKTAGSTASVTGISSVGSLPTMPTYTVANEVLTITAGSQGSLPTKATAVTVKTGDAVYQASQPTFTGTQGTVSVS